MPVIVQDPPAAGADHLTLDVPEHQALQGFPGDLFPQHHRLLVIHVRDAIWILATPTLEVYQDNFEGDDITPLRRSSPFPLGVRPIFAFTHLTEAELTDIRQRATALAAILGVASPTPMVGVGDARWLYSDMALLEFNTEVPLEMMTAGDHTVVRGTTALISRVDPNDPTRVRRLWTTAERVRDIHRAAWLGEKREGAGRDPRLSSLTHDPSAPRPLFRDAVAGMDRTVPLNSQIFGGDSTIHEVADGLIATGLEPPGYHSAWVTGSGVTPSGPIAREHFYLIMFIWYMAVVDRLNIFASVAAEHASRRILALQKAVRKNPRNPDFSGLEAYNKHVPDPGGALPAPKMDQHSATLQKNEAFFMKQTRLAREETEAEAKRKGKNGKGGDAATPP